MDVGDSSHELSKYLSGIAVVEATGGLNVVEGLAVGGQFADNVETVTQRLPIFQDLTAARCKQVQYVGVIHARPSDLNLCLKSLFCFFIQTFENLDGNILAVIVVVCG